MRRIVLDSSALISQPSTGSFSAPDTRFVIPDAVVGELLRTSPGSAAAYAGLLNQMVVSGSAEVTSVAKDENLRLLRTELRTPLSMADVDVLAVANELKRAHPTDEVVIASNDRSIDLAGRQLGLRVLSTKELAELLKANPQDAEVNKRANEVVRYDRKHLILSAIGGAAGAIGTLVILKNFAIIISTVRIWGTLIALPVAGVSLFWIRARQRLGYGIAECFVGLVGAGASLWPTFRLPDTGLAATLLQLVGGLYVMVRGLENLSKGLRGTSLGVRWARWFPE